MGTVIGMRHGGDVTIAGDRRVSVDGSVRSNDHRHVVEVRGIGIGITGRPGDIRSFRDRLDEQLRTYEHRGAGTVRATVLEQLLGNLADRFDVACLAVAPDNDGTPRLLRCGEDGGCTDEPMASIGSGAAVAIGQLEAIDSDTVDPTTLVDLLGAVAERDAGTNDRIDLWSASSGLTTADNEGKTD